MKIYLTDANTHIFFNEISNTDINLIYHQFNFVKIRKF